MASFFMQRNKISLLSGFSYHACVSWRKLMWLTWEVNRRKVGSITYTSSFSIVSILASIFSLIIKSEYIDLNHGIYLYNVQELFITVKTLGISYIKTCTFRTELPPYLSGKYCFEKILQRIQIESSHWCMQLCSRGIFFFINRK